MSSRLALAGLAAGTASLLGACMYDPGTYGQPAQPAYGQAYGGAYAPAPPPDNAQYGYAPDDSGYAYTSQDDAYLPYVADSDVVLIGGDTFIWINGPDGHRYRRFYAHGDHRADVFQRRNQVRTNGGWHGGAQGGAPGQRFGGNAAPANGGWRGANPGANPGGYARPGQPNVRPAAPAMPATGGGFQRQPAPESTYHPPVRMPTQAPQNVARPENPGGPRPGFNPGNGDNRPRQDQQRANPQERPSGDRRWPPQP